MQRVAVELGVHGDGAHAQLLAGADDPDGDLAPVGDQDLGEHGCVTYGVRRGRRNLCPGDRARAALAGSRFADVRWVAETGSTNADLLALARDGAPEGIVLVADHQTAGRGRLGRTWEAPPGASLLVSVLLRPPAAVADAVTMAAGVAMADAVDEVAGVHARLKWPNDLVVAVDGPTADDRKLAGILAEADWPARAKRQCGLVTATADRAGGGRGRHRAQRQLARRRARRARRVLTACNHLAGHESTARRPARRLPPRLDDRYGAAAPTRRPTGRAASTSGGPARPRSAGGSGSTSAPTTSRAPPSTSTTTATRRRDRRGRAADLRGRRRRPPALGVRLILLPALRRGATVAPACATGDAAGGRGTHVPVHSRRSVPARSGPRGIGLRRGDHREGRQDTGLEVHAWIGGDVTRAGHRRLWSTFVENLEELEAARRQARRRPRATSTWSSSAAACGPDRCEDNLGTGRPRLTVAGGAGTAGVRHRRPGPRRQRSRSARRWPTASRSPRWRRRSRGSPRCSWRRHHRPLRRLPLDAAACADLATARAQRGRADGRRSVAGADRPGRAVVRRTTPRSRSSAASSEPRPLSPRSGVRASGPPVADHAAATACGDGARTLELPAVERSTPGGRRGSRR